MKIDVQAGSNIPAAILLNSLDNVAVARREIAVGEASGVNGIVAAAVIPRGHKIAIRPIAKGEAATKYGQTIGIASCDIAPGDHVHLQNIAMQDSDVTHHFSSHVPVIDFVPEAERRTFEGYQRPDGQVGTRNYIGIISSVNCSATVSHAIADHFNRGGGLNGYDNIDGVVALTHGQGCAIGTGTEGYEYLIRTLSGYARNPNFAGILMIGLGCEVNQISLIQEKYGLEESQFLRTMTIQQLGGTRKTVEVASAIIVEMLDALKGQERTTQPLSKLKLALQCGGSDGYSGISANPALGHASDLLVKHGGTAVLSETPEIYGAEHLLTMRAVKPEVAQKLMDRIEWWGDYTARHGAELNNNPSHGNKAGGLTTILEKSLGAVAKGGSMPMQAVYEYAEIIDETGFVFMDTPGYDPVAVTGQIAGGCNMLIFTTGRGSVSGFKPVPTIKVATNTEMFEHMSEDMDVNCGDIVNGRESIEEAGERIFETLIAVASGQKTLSEIYDYGNNEFVPWQLGAIT